MSRCKHGHNEPHAYWTHYDQRTGEYESEWCDGPVTPRSVSGGLPTGDQAATKLPLGDLLTALEPLDYDPCAEAWICDDHGVPDCRQAEHCRSLPWGATTDFRLGEFIDWAREQFLRIVGPYDRGEVPEMPEGAFLAYSVSEWRSVVAAVVDPAEPPTKDGDDQ